MILTVSLHAQAPADLGISTKIPATILMEEGHSHVNTVNLAALGRRMELLQAGATSEGPGSVAKGWSGPATIPSSSGSGSSGPLSGPGNWSFVPVSTFPTARHECSFVQAGDQFLLLGGRGVKPVDAYDVQTGTWNPLNPTPQEIHHFQATAFHGLVYILGAFEGNFPNETGIPFIYVYDPLTDTWFTGPNIPGARIRGSAGLVLHNDVFYLAAGITNGHTSGWVPWLDAFDPVTNAWTVLPDAPRARDHFHAAVLDDKLVCAGGRRSGEGGSTFNAVVLPTDVFDFNLGTWTTLPSPAGDIPTGRAGTMSAVVDGELLVFGGESGSQSVAHEETEALDLNTGTWRTLDVLQRARHGSQAIVSNGGVYVAAGSGNRGGTPELNTMEEFHFGTPTLPDDTPLTPPVLALGLPGSASALPGDSVNIDVVIQHTAGNQAALVHHVSLAGDPAFSLPAGLILPFALPPSGSLPLAVQFAPNDTGSFAAVLTVVYGGLGDTVQIALTGEGGGCDATQAPTGLVSSIGGSNITFTWNPVAQAEQCELSGRRAGTSGFAKLRFAVPPHSISVGSSNFLPGTTYEWRIRCACSVSPVSATPLSALASFTTPPPIREEAPNANVDLLIHPVPATETVVLAWPSAEGSLLLRVQDVQGRLIHQERLNGASGQVQLTRDGAAAGLYMVRITGLPGGPVHRSLVWE